MKINTYQKKSLLPFPYLVICYSKGCYAGAVQHSGHCSREVIILKAAFLIFHGGLRLLQRVGFGLQVHINTNTKIIAAVTCGHCQPILRMMVSLHPLIFPFMYLLPVNLTAHLPSTKSNFSLNSFPANGFIFYPLKTTENERFSSAFKKYKMDKASNGLQEKSSFILQVQPN